MSDNVNRNKIFNPEYRYFGGLAIFLIMVLALKFFLSLNSIFAGQLSVNSPISLSLLYLKETLIPFLTILIGAVFPTGLFILNIYRAFKNKSERVETVLFSSLCLLGLYLLTYLLY